MTASDENFTTERPAREQAIEHIEHRRRYRTNMAIAFFALLIALLAAGF